jgi:hypothetical protein
LPNSFADIGNQLLQHWHHSIRIARANISALLAARTGTMEAMNAAIVVLLILLATGVVVGPLLRLRAWMRNSAPAQEFQQEPPDDEAE